MLTTRGGQALPAGPFQMLHRSLQAGLRSWVESQTQHSLGYVEQLYTFADREREEAAHVLSISYLGLTREPEQAPPGDTSWQDGTAISRGKTGATARLRSWRSRSCRRCKRG